jgi:hypothetical protein
MTAMNGFFIERLVVIVNYILIFGYYNSFYWTLNFKMTKNDQ